MMIVFLDFVPMCTNPCFQLLGAWEYFTCAEEKTPQKLHAIIRFLCKCVNTFWLGSFQGTEVAFYVFDSTWEGKEGDKSHPLWVWKIRSKNMAYTCVHVLQIHVCHLETCKSRHDICLRDGSEACRKIVMTFLTIFFWHKRQNWVLAQNNTSTVLCLPKHVGMAEMRWGCCYSPFCLKLFGSILRVQLAVEIGRTHRHYLATSLPHPYPFWLSFPDAVSFLLGTPKAEILLP